MGVSASGQKVGSVPKYEQIEIGKGVFGNVYLRRHIETKQEDVDKRIQLNFLRGDDREIIHAFEKAKIMDRFYQNKHPHVVDFIEPCQLDDCVDCGFHASVADSSIYHIYMEYCSGGSLDLEIKEHKTNNQYYQETEVLSNLYQIANGLAFIHENKFIHRNLKPANVLKNDEGMLKITDFGLGAVLSHTASARKTKKGILVYRAPEVLDEDEEQWKLASSFCCHSSNVSRGERGRRGYDNKCDIWSLGVLIYEMSTLKLPFSATSNGELLRKIRTNPFNPVNREISDQLQKLLTKMMLKSASDRPTSDLIVEMEFVAAAHEKWKKEPPAQAACVTMPPKKGEDPKVLKVLDKWKNEWEVSERKKQYNYTLLHYVCWKGASPAIVNAILHKSDDIEAKDSTGCTPLYEACSQGHLKVVKVLVSHKANVNAAQKDGFTPLHIACEMGNLEVARTLVAFKANVDAVQKDGCTPLYIACYQGHLQVVRELVALKPKKANVDAVQKDGCTPLYIACQNGHLGVVQELVTHEANVDAARKDGATPLYIACQKGYLEVVRTLVSHEAKLEAALSSTPSVVAHLEEKGGFTPLHIACVMGHLKVVRELVSRGAKVNAKDVHGNTPAANAANTSNTAVLVLLKTK